MYLQYLQGWDLVFEHFLGLVEIWQHVLRLSAVDGAQFGQLPLVPLRQLLLSGPEERKEQIGEETQRRMIKGLKLKGQDGYNCDQVIIMEQFYI